MTGRDAGGHDAVGDPGAGGDFDAALQEMLDTLTRGEASAARRRRRMLQRAEGEEQTLAGLLHRLAEARAAVVVATRDGRTHRGVATAVGADFLATTADTGLPLLVRRDAIASVRLGPGQRPVSAGTAPAPARDVHLLELLAELAPDGPQISVQVDGDASGMTGQLVAAGRDLVTVRALAGAWTDVHIPAERIVCVLLR